MEGYRFPSEPLANSESCVVGPQYRFTMLNDQVMRYEWSADGVFEDRASTFAINRKFPKPKFRVEEQKDQLDIITPTFQLTYDKQKFSPNGFLVAFAGNQTERGDGWRFGTDGEENLGGTARTLDGVDGRCDMGTGIISRAGYAVLDDSGSMLFDGHGFVTTRLPGERIDGYLFCYGLDYKGAMRSFFAISGTQPSVPRWCLGNWWSRYYAYEQEEYLTLMEKFKSKDIPLSVAVIDMDWHEVKGDKVPHAGWTGYTWNKDLFPDPLAFAKDLHDRRLKITLNIHPHAGIHSHEEPYEELAKALGHDTTHEVPILFDPTSQKFMYAYFHVLHRKLEEDGCDFWWIDWQQGSYTRIPGIDPLWLLNHFHYLDQKQGIAGSQALIFSRYAGPGSHRYPVGFSGDTFATWESLEFQPEFTVTASNIGYGWWSHDIGGHIFGSRDDECAVRWVQFGVFSPIMRLHSSNSKWQSKEPWLYRSESELAMRDFMQFRHRMVPYIYSNTFSETLPLLQPLYWNWASHDSAYRFPNQYYFGSALVAAPVVSRRDGRTNLAKTRVWVPPGRHVDVLTGYVYDGDQEVDMYRTLQQLPLLAAEGSIIPLDRDSVPANGCPNPSAFEVLVVVGQDGQFTIHENNRDDIEQGAKETSREIPIEYKQSAGRLTVPGAGREWTFRFLSTAIDFSAISVQIDGKASTEAECFIDNATHIPRTVIKVPLVAEQSLIKIELGSNPQLTISDHLPGLSNFLLDYQIEPVVKDQIWRVLSTTQPKTVKIARLLSLNVDPELLGPCAELLLSDSR
jgi:alpha-glucosidase (family GH31 glycosyl hydrolase)